MAQTHTADTWQSYRMEYRDPYRSLEPIEQEIAAVDEALDALAGAGLLPHTTYDSAKMLAHREAVRAAFDLPWTAITPRMERLIYAINAIRRPRNMIAAGVFCGFTFISNAGAAVGPGACYEAENLIGVEIRPEEAARAERNVRRIDPTGVARVIAADAIDVVAGFDRKIDLLYLDADGDRGRGKGIYLDILEAALPNLSAGALLLAHNSMNGGAPIQRYLEYVRNPANIPASVNVVLDIEGLEVSAAP
jgi:predicted O-methyltransferase YrrM